MKPTLRNIKAIVKKFVDGPDRYINLSLDELSTYYKFAVSGYVTKGKFIYADTQSMAKYVDGELLVKYLNTLKEREGLAASQKEYQRLQAWGYLYTHTHKGREVLCTCEGKAYLQNKV